MSHHWQHPYYEEQGGNEEQAANYNAPPVPPPPFYFPPPYPAFGWMRQQPPSGQLPLEQSYVENILRLNRGKVATFYMTYENNSEWNAKVFRGRIEEAGRDHIVISDLETGKSYLLLMVTLDYVEFDEPINYEYPYSSQVPLAQYPPR